MKKNRQLHYVLTEEDARRLMQLSQTLSRAIAELIESRCQGGFACSAMGYPSDYDLHELSVYEQAHSLRQSHSAENEY